MTSIQFPFHASDILSLQRSSAHLIAFLMAPPEHVLSQTSILPNINLYHHIQTKFMDLISPGYYSTGHENDQRVVSVCNDKAWFFSPRLFQSFATRFSMYGWKGNEEPELVLLHQSGAMVSVSLTHLGGFQPIAGLIGTLIKLTEDTSLAERMSEPGTTMRQLMMEAMVPRVREMAEASDQRLIRVVEMAPALTAVA